MTKLAPACRLLLIASSVLQSGATLWADGGAVRFSEQRGDQRISVFTAPTPLRAGPVDISVLVQEAASGELIPQARVVIRLAPHGQPERGMTQPATPEAATNKLFQAAVFNLPEAGIWDVEIRILGPGVPVTACFEMEIAEPAPRISELLPWMAWPGAAILLFVIHRWLVERKRGALLGPLAGRRAEGKRQHTTRGAGPS